MSESHANGELGGLLEELKAVADDAQKVFGGLTPAQLNWKPSAEQWSVGQCFEHLIRTNRGLLPTLETVVNGPNEDVVGSIPPVQNACLACHDSDAAAAHAETNTTGSGAEACAVCHGEGSVEAVSVVHAFTP